MIVFIFFFLMISLKGMTQNKLKQNNHHNADETLLKKSELKLNS